MWYGHHHHFGHYLGRGLRWHRHMGYGHRRGCCCLFMLPLFALPFLALAALVVYFV